VRPDALTLGDTGRNAFLEPDEPGMGLVIARHPFWRDRSEELTWLAAVEECRPFRGEPLTQHLARIAEKAGAKITAPPAKEMPRLPYRDDSEMAADLWRQKAAILSEETK
jgi:hypothetical protein